MMQSCRLIRKEYHRVVHINDHTNTMKNHDNIEQYYIYTYETMNCDAIHMYLYILYMFVFRIFSLEYT